MVGVLGKYLREGISVASPYAEKYQEREHPVTVRGVRRTRDRWSPMSTGTRELMGTSVGIGGVR